MRTLADYGLLLVSDAKLPSVAGIVAGEPIRGSWWGLPQSHQIFQISVKIEDSGDAIVCKLVSSKQTFVHRKLWSALASIGISNEPWQIQGLATTAKQLLKTISKTGEVRTDEVSLEQAADRKSVQAAVRELERRLLVCSEEVHTESGAHAKVLTT